MSNIPLYLNEDLIARVLPPDAIYRGVEQTLRALAAGRVINGAKGNLSIDDEQGRRYMGAVSGALLDQAVAGVKWFATCNDNPARGLPRVPATILVCDGITGQMRGILEARALTAWRTAALAAVAVNHCLTAPVGKAAIVGFGAIGQLLPYFLAAQTRAGSISVSGRNFEKTKADCETVARALQVPIVAEPTLEAAVQGADIVVTASGLDQDAPFLRGSWLKPGVTVCALGSYQEIDETVIARANRIFVDNWAVCQVRGNLAPFVRSRRLSGSDIAGEVADMVAGKLPARTSPDETILIVLIGLGALDIALAAQALEAARQQGIGLELR
jgi:ornithine cyclodeaminase/alanine dehydrogenase-like protein (mu-crystallin family)